MLEALSYSDFAQWMVVSSWAYPALLTAHGLGMAVVVGLVVMTALRVLGYPNQVPLGPYARALPLGIAAFVINAASGTALFVADAVTMWANPSFQFKLVSIVAGLVVLWLLFRGPVGRAATVEAGGGVYVAPAADKVLAILAIVIWTVAVIVSGRLIAYLAPDLFLM
jgi:hypothetical protein